MYARAHARKHIYIHIHIHLLRYDILYVYVDIFLQVGGFDGSTGLNSAEMYDSKTYEWRMIAPMSTRRSSVGVGVVSGFLYAVSTLIK